MARIRTVKPDFWGSAKVARWSLPARLVAIGLLTEADDEGRLLASPKRIAGALFPNDDDVTEADVAGWLDELEAGGFVVRYEVDGVKYAAVCGFQAHQRVSHPTPSKLPPPPSGGCPEDLASPSRGGREDFAPEQGTGNREQGEPRRAASGAGVELVLVEPPATEDPVRVVFDAWIHATGRTPRTILDQKRRRLIARALETYTLEEVTAAVQGWRHSPHHCGANTQGTTYNDLELLLRDAQHIERFRDLEISGGKAGRGAVLPKGATAVARAVERARAAEGGRK